MASRILVSTAASLVAVAGSAALADTAWDTLGPTNEYHSSTGGILRGPSHANGPFWTGVQFTAQASGVIMEIDLAVVNNTGAHAGLYRAELWSDDNNQMGAVIADFGAFPGHVNGEPPAHIQVSTTAGAGTLIDAGTTYWMVVKGEMDSTGAWRRSLLPDPGLRSFTSNEGVSWSYFQSDPRYAFRVVVAPGATCYADCDGNESLNIDDFICFINEFSQAQMLPISQQIEHYANCDGSTSIPVLTIDDFICFINEFAQGCP